ncbi:hypothetical protein [Pseudomonas oryzihabitans]|uniref:hypothetical protein n=1 Tax=Pseudomonas oryzihabitans TaxID=47885 RepID=UPI00286170FE|nr:hypothetical protein [Pseudomonas psychrotolerans]MDR6679603.1 hypothetical protein [Pseudomonas psychrotolerans]
MLPGDIVFTVAHQDDKIPTKVPRVFIRAGQWLKAKVFHSETPNLPIVHAAIAWDATHVIESVGAGIRLCDLSQEQPPRSAMVYSCTDQTLAAASAYAAQQFQQDTASGGIPGGYSTWKAMLSIFRRNVYGRMLPERLNESIGIGDSSFCSQFVANAYEVGNLYSNANLEPLPPPIFNIRPTLMTPWELAAICDNDGSFYFAGFWEDGQEVRL